MLRFKIEDNPMFSGSWVVFEDLEEVGMLTDVCADHAVLDLDLMEVSPSDLIKLGRDISAAFSGFMLVRVVGRGDTPCRVLQVPDSIDYEEGPIPVGSLTSLGMLMDMSLRS